MTAAQISHPALRALRAALFATLVVTFSAASHVLLSRVPLPPATVAATAVAVFSAGYALGGRERGFGQIAGLLIPLELAADTVFTSGQQSCYGASGGPIRGTLRSVGFGALCGGSGVGSALPGVPGGHGMAGGPDPTPALLAHADPAVAWLLLAAHISVGLLAAAWLRRAERALAQLLGAAVAATFRPLLIACATGAPRGTATPRLPRPAHRPWASGTRLWAHSVGRRGPPCSSVAVS